MNRILILLMLFCVKSFAMTANISKGRVFIDAGFAGDKILVFGNKEAEGKLVIILKSVKMDYKVYNKQKVFGIWQNANPRIFRNIYSFYAIQTESGVNIGRDDLFREFEIGLLNINFYNFTRAKEALKAAQYKDAFLKYKKANHNFTEEFDSIQTFNDSDIFISEVAIPADIKPGKYLLQVILTENGTAKEVVVFTVKIEQIGLISKIKNLSQHSKYLYAVISIGLSIFIAFASFVLARVLYYNRQKH